MFAKNPNKLRFAKTKLTEDEVPVRPFLAYDLRDLDQLRRQGTPLSSTSVENMYYDGIENPSFDVPFEQQRGVDINDVWNAAQDGLRRVSNAGLRKVDSSNSKS